jgi:sugar phosphate permease
VFLVYLSAFPIFLAMWLWVHEPRREARADHAGASDPAAETAAAFPWRRVAIIGLVTLFSSTLYYVFIIQGGLAFREVGVVSPAEIGATIGLGNLASPVGAIIFGLTGRRGAGFQIFLFLALTGAGLLGMGLADSRDEMFAGLLVQQLGQGMGVPVLIAWAQGQLAFEHRGRGMGVWTCAFFLAQFSSPLVVGLVRGSEGSVQSAFYTLGGLGLAGGVAALLLALRARASEAAADPRTYEVRLQR